MLRSRLEDNSIVFLFVFQSMRIEESFMRSGQTCDLLKFVNSSLCCGIHVQIIFEVTFSSFRGHLEIIFFDNLNIFHSFNKIEFRLI